MKDQSKDRRPGLAARAPPPGPRRSLSGRSAANVASGRPADARVKVSDLRNSDGAIPPSTGLVPCQLRFRATLAGARAQARVHEAGPRISAEQNAGNSHRDRPMPPPGHLKLMTVSLIERGRPELSILHSKYSRACIQRACIQRALSGWPAGLVDAMSVPAHSPEVDGASRIIEQPRRGRSCGPAAAGVVSHCVFVS